VQIIVAKIYLKQSSIGRKGTATLSSHASFVKNIMLLGERDK
jgi:hypothetical protein